MERLSRKTASAGKYPDKVIQFGEGNFLRAFVDWIIWKMDKTAGFNAGVTVVQPIERGMVDMLNAQDGLYHLNLQGIDKGQSVDSIDLIDVINRGINPYTDFDEYIRLAENPHFRFVISNTTEAGITFDPSCRLEDRPASSYPGKLTQLLYRRFKYFDGDRTKGFIILPCELIFLNGKELKEEWSWNYTYADISVSMENGVLILSGAPLNGNMYGTALCVRAQETDYVFETEIVQSGQQLKGLTLYGDSGNMAVWGYRDGKLVMDVIMDGKETVLFSTPWEGPAHLRMAVDAGTVTGIWWSRDGKEWLSPENLSLDVTERWDRVQRPGLIYCGGPDGNAEFSYFTISYR